MAYNRHSQKQRLLASHTGEWLQRGVSAIGALKGAYDTGRTIYAAAQAARPALMAAAAML